MANILVLGWLLWGKRFKGLLYIYYYGNIVENNTTETVVAATDVEQPKKPKREKPIPGRKRGVGKKPFEDKVALQSGYWLRYSHEKRNVPILCDNCGRETTKAKMHRHVKSLYCARHA